MTDPLDEIKARRDERMRHIHQGALPATTEFLLRVTADIDTLIGEVEEWRQAADAEANLADERNREVKRLRGLLGRLEWAGGIGYEGEPCCPVCKQLEDFRAHAPGCELAAAIRPSNNPPKG